jgi:hypothetical protein
MIIMTMKIIMRINGLSLKRGRKNSFKKNIKNLKLK